MSNRIIHDADFMNYVMTTPKQEAFTKNYVKVDVVRVLDRNRCDGGLGQLPTLSMSGSSESQSWIMPVVVIVVSAMALMTLYAVLSKR